MDDDEGWSSVGGSKNSKSKQKKKDAEPPKQQQKPQQHQQQKRAGQPQQSKQPPRQQQQSKPKPQQQQQPMTQPVQQQRQQPQSPPKPLQQQPIQQSQPVQQTPQPVQPKGAWGQAKTATEVTKVTQKVEQLQIDKPSSDQPKAVPQQSKKSAKGTPSKSSSTITRFVPRPQRIAKPPGRVVPLYANLIKIIIAQDRVVYQSSVNVDRVIDDVDSGAKKTADDGKVAPSKKLGNDIRRELVTKAISDFLENNLPELKKKPYYFVMDSNASIVIATFDISDKDSSRKSMELYVDKSDTGFGGDVKSQTFKVTIFKPVPINLQDHETAQEQMRALNVILTSNFCTIPRFLVSRGNINHAAIFPYEQKNQFKISEGVICNKGYSVSARPAEIGVVLNVANTSAPFYEDCDLVDFVQRRYSVRLDAGFKLGQNELEKLRKEVRTKQVEALHINYGTKNDPKYRKYRIQDIGSSSEEKMTLVDKTTKKIEEITIKEYYKRTYKYNLKYPKLPCIIDNGRKIPLELCRLVQRQKVNRKLTPDETAVTITKTAMPAFNHFAEVERNIEELCKYSQKTAKEFGIELNPKLIEVDGRELPPIKMKGGQNRIVPTMDGQYNVQRERFYKPTKVTRWVVAFLRDFKVDRFRDNMNNGTRNEFSNWYGQGAQSKGVAIGPISDVHFIPPDGPTLEHRKDVELKNMLKQYYGFLNDSKVDHVIFILPNGSPDWIYGYLQYVEASVKGSKRQATENWTRASCIKYDNFERKILRDSRQGSMFIANLWLKYNTKLGGTNFVLQAEALTTKFLQPNYLFVSVDVCHPAPGDKLIQSVAAVVGMWDLTGNGPNGISYSTQMRVQKKENENKSTIEHVLEIDKMFEGVLDSYKKSKNNLPTHVIILRDGVSEGQFEIVLKRELSLVEQVLANTYSKVKRPVPLMSCFVVQKRHKIRFKRKEPVKTRRGDDDYNIQPGTVVDKDVTHPTDHSFYIAPHKAIQGTARAAYIYMIYDQIKFSQDEAQALIFSLSYLSPRCTKGTSIPTPVNLADRAAERGKNLVIAWNSDNETKMKDDERIQKLNKFLATMGDYNYRHTLYYI